LSVLDQERTTAHLQNMHGKMSDRDYERVLESLNRRKTVVEQVFNDEGRFAALKGYDAIDVTDLRYIVVLNRSATVVVGGKP
jgi:hypothetical protein